MRGKATLELIYSLRNGSQLGDGRDQALPAPELLAAAARAEVILQQAGRPILTLQSDPLARAVLLAVLGHAAVLFVAPPCNNNNSNNNNIFKNSMKLFIFKKN